MARSSLISSTIEVVWNFIFLWIEEGITIRSPMVNDIIRNSQSVTIKSKAKLSDKQSYNPVKLITSPKKLISKVIEG